MFLKSLNETYNAKLCCIIRCMIQYACLLAVCVLSSNKGLYVFYTLKCVLHFMLGKMWEQE